MSANYDRISLLTPTKQGDGSGFLEKVELGWKGYVWTQYSKYRFCSVHRNVKVYLYFIKAKFCIAQTPCFNEIRAPFRLTVKQIMFSCMISRSTAQRILS